ncbi:MAG TPA: cupredoxin domain-containing protein [Candidatus Limnocylindrales bacterium]|nr:cupredoxin domain-containing protein [Candidatus Limnocylindrales bacterium]
MTRGRGIAAVALAGLMAVAIGAGRGAAESTDRAIEIDIHYSHFEPARLTVPVGQPIRFVIVNGDAIDHEWIVGDAVVHERHRAGTEPTHGARPTEQSVPAGTTVETVVTFATPGTFLYICHLPQHEAYGMVGEVIVGGG